MIYPLLPPETNGRYPVVLVYAISMTALFLFIVVILLLQQRRKSRLNWYDQNLLEIASTQPNYVRCKALSRFDTDEDREADREAERREKESPTSMPARKKQSRVRELVPHKFEANKLAGELSGAFFIPKAPKGASMFDNPVQSQIDRGLYATSMDAESQYNGEGQTEGCCGSIKMAIGWDANMNLLTISLKQAMDLVPKRQDECPNPYFKVGLDVPESTLPKSEHQSKIFKNTASPLINEDFYFQIPNPLLLQQCRLELLAYDYDQFSIDECIGYCWLTLGRLSLCPRNTQPTIFWAEVLPFDDDYGHGFGEVLLSLTYLSKAQRLTVNVFKARNLNLDYIDNPTANAIRVNLMTVTGRTFEKKRIKRKRTSASKKSTRNPQFNESLVFQVPKSLLCDIVMEVEAIHECGTFGIGVKVLGKMELPLHRCKDMWRAIIYEEKSQARWYTLEEP